jgi:hypothetical protein
MTGYRVRGPSQALRDMSASRQGYACGVVCRGLGPSLARYARLPSHDLSRSADSQKVTLQHPRGAKPRSVACRFADTRPCWRTRRRRMLSEQQCVHAGGVILLHSLRRSSCRRASLSQLPFFPLDHV